MSADIEQNLKSVKDEIKKYSDKPDEVALVAVSKFQPADSILKAVEAGQVDFGENYANELEAKYNSDLLKDLKIQWNYIGKLQSKKIRKLAKIADTIQTVSRLKELELLAVAGYDSRLLIELKFTESTSKSGADAKHLDLLLKRAETLNLKISGIMTMGEQNDRKGTEVIFKSAFEIYRGYDFRILSMGMSGDFDIALANGSNMIRVGTAIFGKRDIKSGF
jgi:pyridoxal phosphate enzyme (YggS family)